jgi:uncharacterized membrane protein
MFEFLFKYPQEVYTRGRFVFDNSWPIGIIPVILLCLAPVIIYFLYRHRHALSTMRLACIGILQFTMLALVLVLIWQPSLLLERLRPGANLIAVLLDTSASMTYGQEGASRMDQARNIIAGPDLKRLQQDYQFRRFVFADRAEAVENFDTLPAPGATTRLGDSVLRVLRQAGTASLGAIILLSDGADNSGAISPEQLAEIGGYGVPVHTIGIGREKIPEDVELTDVVLPGKALPDSSLSARVNIRHDGGGEARVKVYDGDEFLAARTVDLDEKDTSTSAWLEFKLRGTGHRDLRFSVDPIPGERELRNNVQTRVINIPETSYRVLYVEGEPRWEYKFMRRALEGDVSVNLVGLLQVSPNKFYRQGVDSPAELEEGFPADQETLYPFQAVIIGSIPAASFTSEQQELLRDFVSVRGGSLMLLAGPNGLGDGGWGNTVLNDALPAVLSDSGNTFNRARAHVTLTPLGRESPMLKLSDDLAGNDKLWKELPDIADYQAIGALRPAAVTLLEYTVDNRAQPLLVAQPYGRGHSYILATGGTWRWQMSLPVEDQRHESFWRQLIRGLVAPVPERFELSGEIHGDELAIHAEVRDARHAPESDISVAAVLTQSSGEPVTLNLRPVPAQPGIFSGAVRTDVPGRVNIEVITSRDDTPVASARMTLYNDAGNAEAFSLRLNRTILERLAEVSGGQYWNAGDLARLPDAIQLSRAGITEQDLRPLWDAPLVFLLLVLLKAGEWGLRRRWRTI